MRSGCWSAVNAPLLGDDNAPAFPDVRMVVDDIDQPCGLLAGEKLSLQQPQLPRSGNCLRIQGVASSFFVGISLLDVQVGAKIAT